MKLKCRHCGTVYKVGRNATVITTEGEEARFTHSVTLSSGHLPDRRDLVAFLPRERMKLFKSEIKDEINMICRSLAAGQNRVWICKGCQGSSGGGVNSY